LIKINMPFPTPAANYVKINHGDKFTQAEKTLVVEKVSQCKSAGAATLVQGVTFDRADVM
jgi:hypothetical protein